MKFLKLLVVSLGILSFIISCSDKKDDNGNDQNGDNGHIDDHDDGQFNFTSELKFNLKNTDMIITANSPVAVSKSKNVLRTIADNGDDFEPEEFVYTNAVGVGMDGEIVPLIETSENMIDIELAMVDPKGKYLYIVIEGPWELIEALNGCRFVRAPVDQPEESNLYECVSYHWTPVFAYGNYGERLAGERKPIHFDNDGNLFFLGENVHRQNALLRLETAEESEIPDDYPPELISPLGKFVRITDTAQNPSDFLVTPTGVPVWTGSTQAGSGWFLKAGLPEGGEVTFSSSQVKFYATDTYDAILWAAAEGDECRGIRFARLSDTGGFTRRCFRTNRFTTQGWGMAIPEHLMLANDGFYYGLFEEADSNIFLYRILPFNPEPIMGVEFKGNWHYELPAYISQGNFQISHQHVFAIIEINDPNYGIKNVIRAVRVDTREEKLLFNSRRVEIYRFKISGDTMFVVGRDLNKMVSFVAEVDMAGLVRDEDDEKIIKESETYNAALDSENIRDMAIVRPSVPEKPTGVNPKLMDVIFDQDEPQVATLSFSVPVEEASVEGSLSLKDSSGEDVETFGVWGYANLHLLTGNSKTDDGREGILEWGEVYDFELGTKAFDYWNNPIPDHKEKLAPRKAFEFSIRTEDMQPFNYPATLRFVIDPQKYQEHGTTDNIDRYVISAFDESIADDVEGLEVIADGRSYAPHLAVTTHPASAGFSFNLHFYDWPECYEEDPGHEFDCHDFPFCWQPQEVLLFGRGGYGYEANIGSGCHTDLFWFEDNSINAMNFRKLRARRFGKIMEIEEVFEDETTEQLNYFDKATDTAHKRRVPVFYFWGGATVEFREIEIWPLDHEGNRLGEKPFFIFNSEVAENAPALWGEELMNYLGITIIKK